MTALRPTSWVLYAALAVLPCTAFAQRPFDVLDPFYQEETARQTFFDGFAISGEVGYRASGPFRQAADADQRGPLALSFRLDYALTRQLNLGAVFDVSGGLVSQLGGGPVRLSWIVVKPYWHNEDTDYAVRIAIDPVSQGGLGFRQTDIAFLSSSDLSPLISSDFAIGLRHAQVGFERLQVEDGGGFLDPELASAAPEFTRIRAIGKEIHLMWGYRFHFDPAGSNFFVTALAEAMDYDLIESQLFSADDLEEGTETAADDQGTYRGGVGWARAGFEINRPAYRFSPFVSVPMVSWLDTAGESGTRGPRFKNLRLGLRLTLR